MSVSLFALLYFCLTLQIVRALAQSQLTVTALGTTENNKIHLTIRFVRGLFLAVRSSLLWPNVPSIQHSTPLLLQLNSVKTLAALYVG